MQRSPQGVRQRSNGLFQRRRYAYVCLISTMICQWDKFFAHLYRFYAVIYYSKTIPRLLFVFFMWDIKKPGNIADAGFFNA